MYLCSRLLRNFHLTLKPLLWVVTLIFGEFSDCEPVILLLRNVIMWDS